MIEGGDGPVPRWLPGVDERCLRPLPRPDEGALAPLRADLPEPAPERDLPLPWALPACAELLRRAGPELVALPVAARIAGLVRVARSWLDPDDPLRARALTLLPGETGLHPRTVAWGLDRAFEAVTPAALRAWWERRGGSPRAGLSGHVLAGNVFAAGLPPILGSLLAGVPALVKAPSSGPSFAALLARSLARHAPELGPTIGAAAWSREDEAATLAFLSAVDVCFAFGDDASIASLRAASPGPLCGFGHRTSVGFVARGAESVAGLATDALAWDGGGCLSAGWVFVEGDAARARRLAEALIPALEAACEVLPPGPLDEGEGSRRASWLGVEGAMGWARSAPGWAISARASARLEPAPPGRCLALVPVPDRAALPSLLAPLGPRLQGLALVGGASDEPPLRRALEPLGLSRIAPAGRLQIPELAWSHDDVDVLAALR